MLKFLRRFNPGLKPALLALVSGLVMALAFPPCDLWFLAPLCLLPLWYLSNKLTPAAAFSAGWLWGLGQFIAGMYWLVYVMTSYGGMPFPLAILLLVMLCLYLALYMAILCWLLSRLRPMIPLWLAAPFLWVGLEFLRGILITGFPWLSLSLSLSSMPLLMQSAELWGAIGLSFFVVLFSALLAHGLGLVGSVAKFKRLVYLGLALLIAAGFWLGGHNSLQTTQQQMAAAPQGLVSVVQGNIPLDRLWQQAYRSANVMQQMELTAEAAGKADSRPWLVLWSESAAPFIFLRDVDNSMPVLQQAANLRAWIALGTTGLDVIDGQPGYTNRMFLVSPEGQPVDHYDKVHLVPFGEYVPLAKVLFFVRAIAALSVDMMPGQAGKTLKADDIVMGPLICYESIFSELAREHKLNGANLLVNPTNDAWFGPTGATRQHMGQLILRAVENRVSVARSANTGISAFILPTGQVVEQTEMFTPDQRTAWLPLLQKETIFSKYGEVVGAVGLACCLAALIGSLVCILRKKKSPCSKT